MTPLWTTAILAGLVQVRMGIFVGGRPVGGPAGMADAEAAGERLCLQ